MPGKDEVGVNKFAMILRLGVIWGVNTGKAKREVASGSTFYPYLIRLSVKESVVR